MSIVDVWVSPNKAMVIVDTEMKTLEGRFFEGSKMLTLPHANMVIAARGTNVFIGNVFGAMHQQQCTTMDDFDKVMFDLLAHVMGRLKAVQQHIEESSIYRNELALVGYSHHYHAMHAVIYESHDESGFEAKEISDAYYAPWHEPTWGPAPTGFPSAARARSIAAGQIADLLEMHPAQPFGGRLLLAEVTREDLRISTGQYLTSRSL